MPAKLMFNLKSIVLLIILFGNSSQVSLAHASKNEADAGKPNVILMMADDLGWGDTSYNGHEILKTPHLDAMADNGLVFNRFYAGAPVCSPTRGSALTGRHPYRYGIFFANTGKLPRQEFTLTEFLKSKGYRTGHFGKWHLGTLTTKIKDSNRGKPGNVKDYSPPWEHGFDVSFSTEAKVPTYDPLIRPEGVTSNTWWDPVDSDKPGVPYGTYFWADGKLVDKGLRGDDSKVIMDHAIPFIEHAAKNKKPFFTVIWFHTPHLPVVAGKDHRQPYLKYSKYQQHYYGCVAALDEQVGRLRMKLRELGVSDNTMLWFASDNGPEGNAKAPGSAGNLRGRKRSLFEGGVRVPGILEWPAHIKKARKTDVPGSTLDYLPTVMDYLAGKMPDQREIDGTSLRGVIEGKTTQRSKPIPFESRNQAAWTEQQFKLVVNNLGKNEKLMLFDITKDPTEKNDLAKEHPERVKKMRTALEAWRNRAKQSLKGNDY